MRRLLTSCLVLVALIATAGCWDRVELEGRLYGVAVAIDKFGAHEVKGKDLHKAQGELRMTAEVILWEPFSGGEQGGGSGGLKPPKPAWLLSSTADSIPRIVEQYDKVSFRPFSFGHLKVIIVGENTARTRLYDIVDFFSRERETQRRVKFVIAEGEAKKILEVQPKVDKIVGLALPKLISETSADNTTINTTIGDIETNMCPELGLMVPRVRVSGSDLVVAGLAALRGDRFAGWLGERETKGATILTNKAKGGVIEFYSRGAGHDAAARIRYVKTRWVPHVKENKVSFDADISLTVDIEQLRVDITNSDQVRRIEREIADEVRQEARSTLIASKRLRSDFLRLGGFLSQQNPRMWNRLKKRWNDYYADKVDVAIDKVRVSVSQIGQTR